VTLALVLLACHVSQPSPTAAPTPSTDTRIKLDTPSSCDNLTPPSGSQFPSGFDYPQTSATVQSWVNNPNGDGGRTRLHAYCVFAGLNQIVPGLGVPTWRSWGTSTQAFPNQYNPWLGSSSGGGAVGAASGAKPVTINQARSQARGTLGAIINPAPIYGVNQAIVSNPQYQQCLQPIANTNPQLYSLKDGQVFESNGDIMIAAVSYNLPALNNILVDIQAVNSAFAATSMPASAANRSISQNQVFIGVFRPGEGGNPRWYGNLKRYQLLYDSTTGDIDLGDAFGSPALNAASGFIAECAASYWTSDTTTYQPGSSVAAQPYWTLIPGSTPPASLCPAPAASGGRANPAFGLAFPPGVVWSAAGPSAARSAASRGPARTAAGRR